MRVRKLLTWGEEIQREAGDALGVPVRRVAVAAVLEGFPACPGPEDLERLAECGADLGRTLTGHAQAWLSARGARPVVTYGKAAVVGTACELEVGAALIHPRLGGAVRALVGGETMMPSSLKRCAAGAGIDIPLHHILQMWSVDHFDAITLPLADAPLPSEVVLCLAFADGGRPLARTPAPIAAGHRSA